jgi:hypothetical protein
MLEMVSFGSHMSGVTDIEVLLVKLKTLHSACYIHIMYSASIIAIHFIF